MNKLRSTPVDPSLVTSRGNIGQELNTEPAPQSTAINGLTTDAWDAVADAVAAAAIGPDNFTGSEAREARKTW